MGTIVEEGQYKFVIYTREKDFEPPHVHVWIGNENVCRLELNGGQFMENPPSGNYREILSIYRRYGEVIRRGWDEIHGR